MKSRILHVDMDAFFASVEQAEHPEFQRKPLVVVTRIDGPRGVVSSASYEAREYGVSAGMPIREVRRKCPHAILISGNYEKYVYISEQVVKHLYDFAPEVMVTSIDESFLDITGSVHLFGSEDKLALKLKRTLKDKMGLQCTVGIASTYIISKMAVKQAKPDGYLSVPSGKELEFLASLHVRCIPGVGPKAEQTFHSLGIYTIGQIWRLSMEELEKIFGLNYGFHIFQWSRGRDVEKIICLDNPRIISREITFDNDLIYWKDILPQIVKLLEACTYELRQKNMKARRITLKVRYSDFITKTFSYSFPYATILDNDFISALPPLIKKAQERKYQVRLVGIILSGLVVFTEQKNLFYFPQEEKMHRVLRCIDILRTHYGFSLMHWASALNVSTNH
ncbi:MAG: DNA polymerase IV [Candidatus Hydrogenedens sp.]